MLKFSVFLTATVLCLWAQGSNDLLFERSEHDPVSIKDMYWSTNGDAIIVVYGDKPQVIIWDSVSGKKLKTYQASGIIESCAFCAQRGYLALGLHNGTIEIIMCPSLELQSSLSNHMPNRINMLSWSTDGAYLATCSKNIQERVVEEGTIYGFDNPSVIRIWHSQGWHYTDVPFKYNPTLMQWSPLGHYLALVDNDFSNGSIHLSNTDNKVTVIPATESHLSFIDCVHLEQGAIKPCSVSFKQPASITGLAWSDSMDSLALVLDNTHLIIYSLDMVIKQVYELAPHSLSKSLSWAHDGKHIAYSTPDHLVVIDTAMSKKYVLTTAPSSRVGSTVITSTVWHPTLPLILALSRYINRAKPDTLTLGDAHQIGSSYKKLLNREIGGRSYT